ncbi:HAD-like domain containing protein [Trema orientale]|uniref:HAD-like domain containing protein n=1 Tax=Trema orientale TaxID=63057 RepID=A0A2P5AIL0_TREOI|nr:HAD-like domain containing protein [Trema orientale]
MKLQVEFFASQTVPQPTAVPLYRVQDLNEKPHQLTIYPDFDLMSSAEIPQERNKEEFKQFLQTIMRGDPGKVFDYDGLKKAVELVEEFEEKANANAMVVESRELTDHKLKDCCREFFRTKIAEKKNPSIAVRVITSDWRVGLIKSAFSSGQGHMNIHSNNSVYEAVLKRENSGSSEGQHLNVCIGSGVGDLLCLVEADIGIVFGSDKDLRELGKKFGVSFVSLFLGTVTNQMGLDDWKWRPRSGKLYEVHSWGEIQAFIVGYK